MFWSYFFSDQLYTFSVSEKWLEHSGNVSATVRGVWVSPYKKFHFFNENWLWTPPIAAELVKASVQPVFSGQEGVLPLLGGMLHPTYRSRPRIPIPFPAQPGGWHHESSFLAISTAAPERNFGTTNYSKRTHRQTSHADTPFGPYVRTHPALKMRLWRDNCGWFCS